MLELGARDGVAGAVGDQGRHPGQHRKESRDGEPGLNLADTGVQARPLRAEIPQAQRLAQLITR